MMYGTVGRLARKEGKSCKLAGEKTRKVFKKRKKKKKVPIQPPTRSIFDVVEVDTKKGRNPKRIDSPNYLACGTLDPSLKGRDPLRTSLSDATQVQKPLTEVGTYHYVLGASGSEIIIAGV